MAGDHGRAAHPGVALLRLAQGQPDAARSAIERAMAEPARGRRRADVLAAAVEIFLALDEVTAAGAAARELTATAGLLNSAWLRAMAAAAEGAVGLAGGRASEALAPLREALGIWRDLDAAYETARVKVPGRSCLSQPRGCRWCPDGVEHGGRSVPPVRRRTCSRRGRGTAA